MASELPSGHQRKLGPAPIASFEDLSDEVENGESTTRMPGIMEVTDPVTPGTSLKTPTTPRIDISRASSSSHHEDSNNSRESSPELELLAGNDPPPGCKLTLGYKEDAHDLQSSTEELDLQDPIHAQDLRRDSKRARRRKEDGTQSEYGGIVKQDRERKDSNCSEIILLNISGRTSRLSSVGSQGSGVSGKLSVISATSSRSPSPHKCLLETSFCGSKPKLADDLIEPSKPETDDLEKILLKREADTTKVLIPENIKVSIVGGNLKPDALDKPRRRGREERKEIFKREVELTKKILEKANIEVPIIRKPSPSPARDYDSHSSKSSPDFKKPATLDLGDRRKKTLNTNEALQATSTIGSLTKSPKLPRHKTVRELEGSRTPSPSSVSRKSSFASIFKGKADGSLMSPESPTTSLKPRRSITSKIKETTESIRSRSKSRERVSIDRGSSKNKNVFTSTLSLFKKRERKKSTDDHSTPEHDISSGHPSLDSIGNVEFRFEADKPGKNEDSIFISLHADDRNYEEALPSESLIIPLETPTKLLDEYDNEPRSGNIVTEVLIEHRASGNRIRTEAKIESTLEDELKSPLRSSASRDSEISKSSSRESRISIQTTKHVDIAPGESLKTFEITELEIPLSLSRDSIVEGKRKPNIVKPKRKSKEPVEIGQTADKINNSTGNEVTCSAGTSNVILSKEIQKPEMTHNFEETLKPQDRLVKTPSVVSDLDHNSSESERDSEIDFVRNKAAKAVEELPDERKGLFYEESFEEDLPYVPTTLPMEKSAALPILPIKQRVQEVRTIPIERPRSTTPINPTLLDEFVMQTSHDEKRAERMKISLPREDSFKLKSPRKHPSNTFSEFAGRVAQDSTKRVGKSPSPPPPPLPPRAPAPRPTNWINFEEIPERRRAPKRIQTIPRSDDEAKGGYSYVQPDECRCECHEESRRASTRESSTAGSSSINSHAMSSITRTSSCSSSSNGERACNGENCNLPNSGDRASIISDSSLDSSLDIDDNATQALLGPMKPFSMDLDVGSNRSSIISQEETDEAN